MVIYFFFINLLSEIISIFLRRISKHPKSNLETNCKIDKQKHLFLFFHYQVIKRVFFTVCILHTVSDPYKSCIQVNPCWLPWANFIKLDELLVCKGNYSSLEGLRNFVQAEKPVWRWGPKWEVCILPEPAQAVVQTCTA